MTRHRRLRRGRSASPTRRAWSGRAAWTAPEVQAAFSLPGDVITTSAFTHLGTIRRRLMARDRLAVLMDFDGTLAPIAERPDDSALPPLVRALLARLARHPRFFVAIVSGRALDDLKRRVGLENVTYVGNHGVEISGPGWTLERQEAREVEALIALCTRRLKERLRGIRGAIVEDKGLTASVHYRLVRDGDVEAVRQAVREEVARMPPGKLVIRRGKKALEVRPAIAWDKGQAALWLLEHVLGRTWRTRCAVLYAGDDRTDEDAFLALADAGITVRVGASSYPTAATYMVGSAAGLHALLEAVCKWADPAAEPQ